jgi:hypothetical protein
MYATVMQIVEFLRVKNMHEDHSSSSSIRFNWLSLSSWASVSFIFVLYVILLDAVFMVNYAVLGPPAILLKSFFKIKVLNQLISWSFCKLFHMHENEIGDFRRMRMLTQLSYETIIHLILQMMMLVYGGFLTDREIDSSRGSSVFTGYELPVSVGLCILNLIIGID